MREIDRRSALQLAAVATCAVCGVVQEKTDAGLPESLAEIKKEYDEIKSKWMEERKQFSHHSHIKRYWDGPIGQKLIKIGPKILPLVVRELRNGDFFFNYPMQKLTGFLLGGRDLDSEQERAKLWIKWYDELSLLK